MPEETTTQDSTQQEATEQTETQKATADKRTEEALEILDILEDPSRRGIFVENLAKQAGLIKLPETKQEEKTSKRSAKDFVKAHLGEEYKNVAEKLGTAIDEYFADRMGDVDGRLQEFTKHQAERSFNSDFESFIGTNEVTEAEAGAILKQLEVMSPNPNVPLKKFLGEQLELVRFRSGKQTGEKARLKRSAENFGRRAEAAGSESGERTIQPPKTYSIRDAVAAAARGEKWS